MGLLEVFGINRHQKSPPPVPSSNGIPREITGTLNVSPGQRFNFTPDAQLEVVPLEPNDVNPPRAGSGILKTKFIWTGDKVSRDPGSVIYLYTSGKDAIVHTGNGPERLAIEIPLDYYDVKVLPTPEA